MDKTNVMRLLEQKKIPYDTKFLEGAESLTGTEIAQKLGEDPNQAFKTLVTEGKTKNHYVFVIPVNASLDLKKAAKVVSEKSIDMIKNLENYVVILGGDYGVTCEEIDEEVNRPVVKSLLKLMEFRNSHTAFDGDFAMNECSENELNISWKNGDEYASLFADFENKKFEVKYSLNGKEEILKL